MDGPDDREERDDHEEVEEPFEPLVAQNAELRSLIGDPLFRIIEFLDVTSINNLCASSSEFSDFCKRRESQIYRYLLVRDFRVPADLYSNENTKLVYQARHEKSHWAIRVDNSIIFRNKADEAVIARRSIGESRKASRIPRNPFTNNVDVMIDYLWSMRVNICLKMLLVDSPRSTAIYITDGATGFGVDDGRIVEVPMLDANTPRRVIEVCYDRLYPEVLPFIFQKEIPNIFQEIVYPTAQNVKFNRNYPDPAANPGPYRTLLDLFPGNYPALLAGIYEAIIMSLGQLRGELDGRLPANVMAIVDVSGAGSSRRLVPLETRFLESYRRPNKTALIYLVYFNFLLRGLVE
jgi:hypothetical protein